MWELNYLLHFCFRGRIKAVINVYGSHFFGGCCSVSFLLLLQIRMLKRQAMEAVEDMEEMRRTHKDNANVSMQLLKKVGTPQKGTLATHRFSHKIYCS